MSLRVPLLLGLAVASAALAVPAGTAHATDWRLLAAHPERFVGQAIALAPAYCGSGGQEGKQPGLIQCAVGPGAIYVESRGVSYSRSARVKAQSCGGLDVWERSPFCRFAVRLVPTRYRPAKDIDATKPVLLFSTDALAID